MKGLIVILVLFASSQVLGQLSSAQLDSIQPTEEFENIHVQKLASDSLQSTFVIWVKKRVKNHYHAEHTENLYVIDGSATMTMADSTFTIRKGDYLNIPMGAQHSVVSVDSQCALKVLSIQSPEFDGNDRIFVKEED